MARQLNLIAELNFTLSSHSELTAMRNAAINFAATHSGDYKIITSEDPNGQITYFAKLLLFLPLGSRGEAASRMSDIDSALPSLPDLTGLNGEKLSYKFNEVEI